MIVEKIKYHLENKKYAKLFRTVGKNSVQTSSGYIVSYNGDFIILQESNDFRLLGYNILPVKQLKKVRFNKWDKYYDKIMGWEGETDGVGINYTVDLTDWQSVFKSIRSQNLNVIIECEAPKLNTFTIGPIVKITKKKVHIHDFDPSGFFDEKATSIDFDDITKVMFDDRYINIFSKYLRDRKVKNLSKK